MNPQDNPVDPKYTVLDQGKGDPGFDRTGTLMTPEKLKRRYLKGIPMISILTGEEITLEDLKEYISDAVGRFETTIRVPVSPVFQEDKFDFQRADDLQFGTRQLTRFPLLKIDNLAALWPGRIEGLEQDYPTTWVSPLSDSGLIRIVPNSGTLVNSDVSFIASTGFKGILLGSIKSWPLLWRIRYWAGYERDKIPHAVNDLIGTYAALDFISQMGPLIFPVQSYGIGLDGMSQSTATAGPQWLALRYTQLDEKREALETNLRAHYGTDFFFAAF